ncbi:winged helix-turn-helix domain-containing protein [Nocardioides marmoriginsengisoli]|uniref:Winged helix-turn-helix domain-containing protein n=1 Tax=Nocardioides marmoriginsengisoli TaxID=661483 RepID=A0A3N0CHZ8_9ACTN|nr:crosslink repair DNA glycosylase YcaQ family protein [Nocardioides marmoriginsengisoli]RNL63062.1 winged helix-turn-helix domain-containing protein [Nocardioides marmoriginsengisoli]
MQSLSLAQARRVALAAQGFLDAPHAAPTMATLARTVSRTGVLQVDSVNVLQRAHYMPLFSRMGPYDVDLLRRASSGQKSRRLVEYWAHVQAFMPVELWPLMRHRMEQYRPQRGKWWTDQVTPELEASLLAEIADRGPSTSRDLDDGLPRDKKHWGWNWSATRKALDFLYVVGDVAIAGRNSQFEVLYDLPERVIPHAVLDRPVPEPADAHRELIRRAAISHGVGTEPDLRDYYRMKPAESQAAVASLVEDGELVPVRIEGGTRPAYLHRDARLPRRVRARALLSPFDPLVWERARAEHLFGFRYRIEIYVPAEKREFGYYVLPFLLGERIVARVDLKADRRSGTLQVKAAYAEEHAPPETAAELAEELRSLADWLGLELITVAGRGDLSAALRSALGSAVPA